MALATVAKALEMSCFLWAWAYSALIVPMLTVPLATVGVSIWESGLYRGAREGDRIGHDYESAMVVQSGVGVRGSRERWQYQLEE